MNSKTIKCGLSTDSPNEHFHSTPISQHDVDNITRRRKPSIECNVPISNSFELLSDNDEEQSLSESSTSHLYSSLPNTSTQRKNISCPTLQLNSDIIEELKNKILILEDKLEITEHELDNQLSENHALGKKILEYERKVAKLSHICHSTHKSTHLSSSTGTRTKTKHHNKTNLDLSRLSPYRQKRRENIILALDSKEEKKSGENNKSITSLHNLTHPPLVVTSNSDKNKTNTVTSSDKTNICVLSSNKYNKTLPTIENVLSENHHIIHYLKPNCGIKELLRGIVTKVYNYTHKDYCVVFIGDEDFTSSHDHFKLITYIKDALRKIQHTNVILCLPTYRLNKHIFNGRVESFSNMLYWDPEIHDYAYLLDTNLNLEYNHHMYRVPSGLIKSKALRTISVDLKQLISLIKKRISHSCSNLNCNNNAFFRQDTGFPTPNDITR